MSVPREIEVKLRMERLDPLIEAGLSLRLETARHFEDNWLLDTGAFDLGQSAAILRVRKAGGNGSLTYKEKAPADAPASQFKQRVEIETALDDPDSALALFDRLGYHRWFRYQKYRTVYRATLPSGDRLHVMFDETPLGNFVELEGEENAIAEAVTRMGIGPGDYILDSYLALQIARCNQAGTPLEDMLFPSGF
jgi:adenylate cyclase class 2